MVASLVAELGLEGVWTPMLRHMSSVVAAPGLSSTGSVVGAPRFSCSRSCGILPDQGSNWHLLSWQVDCLPLSHQGSPIMDS